MTDLSVSPSTARPNESTRFTGDARLQNATPAAEARHRVRLARLNCARSYHLQALADGTLIATSADTSGQPSYYLTAWIGAAERPQIHCYYRTAEQRAQRIVALIDARSAHVAAKAARRAERAKPHTLQVGAILVSSWGYEQTNVDFYQVIAVRGAVVDLRKIGQEKEHDGDMTGFAMPRPDDFIGPVLIGKRPSSANAVRIKSFSLAMPWDGRRQRWTSYA
ncbi:MAG: hypothetical protein AB7P22_16920 [Vicinamibacterales bacterium]